MTQPMISCPNGHWVPQSQLRYEAGFAVCPACLPVFAVPKAPRIAGEWRVILSAGVLVGLALIVVAFTLAFIPLPTQSYRGTAWCGPGTSSESAVLVRANPGSVNDGAVEFGVDTSSARYLQEAAEFESFCTGVADTRLELVAALLLPGLVLGIGAFALAKTRPRWLRMM